MHLAIYIYIMSVYIYIPTYLPIYLSIGLFIYLSIHPSIYLSIYLIPLGISSTKWRGLTPRNGTKMI